MAFGRHPFMYVARLGWVWHGRARHGGVRCGRVRYGMAFGRHPFMYQARRGLAGFGEARLGSARYGMVWYGLFFKENMEEYYTIKEFAKLLKMHPETIRRMVRDKKVIAIKPGNAKTSHYRIPGLEFERLAVKHQYGEENVNVN